MVSGRVDVRRQGHHHRPPRETADHGIGGELVPDLGRQEDDRVREEEKRPEDEPAQAVHAAPFMQDRDPSPTPQERDGEGRRGADQRPLPGHQWQIGDDGAGIPHGAPDFAERHAARLQGEGLLWLTLTPEGLDQLSAEIADPAGRMPRTDEMQPGGGYPRLSRSRALRHAVRFRRRM